jgi:multiple sugar transport system permease protein
MQRSNVRRRRRSTRRRREALYGYLFASPWIVGFFAFTFIPLAYSLLWSFTDYRLAELNWIGLANYRNLLTDDPLLTKAVYNTAYYAFLAVPSGIIVALAVALLLSQPLRGMKVFRTMFYLPRVVPIVASSLLWLHLMAGPLRPVFRLLGLPTSNWLGDPQWSKPALVLMSLWGVGGTAMIFLAALQGVPRALYEAAEIDGAGAVRRFWSITVPMISPTIFFNLVVGTISAVQTFTQPLIMTRGGPVDSTLFYVLQLYWKGFYHMEMGYASAMAWLLFVAILLLTLLIFRSSALWVFYEGRRQGERP